MKMGESSPKGLKTLREKEKLLIMSNFFFSHSVFKRLLLQTRKNQGLFGTGLKRILRYCGRPSGQCHCAKTLTLYIISVTYLKLGQVFYYQKGNTYNKEGNHKSIYCTVMPLIHTEFSLKVTHDLAIESLYPNVYSFYAHLRMLNGT